MDKIGGVGGPKHDPFVGSGLHKVKHVRGFEDFDGVETEHKPNVWTTNEFERIDMSSLTVESALSAEKAHRDKEAARALFRASIDRVQTRLVVEHDVDVARVDESLLIAMARTLATSERKGVLLRKHVAWSAMPDAKDFGTLEHVVTKMSLGAPRMPVNTFIDNMAAHLPKAENKPTDGTGSSGSGKTLTRVEIMTKYNIRYFEALTPKFGEGVVGGLFGIDPTADMSASMAMGGSVMPMPMTVSALTFA